MLTIEQLKDLTLRIYQVKLVLSYVQDKLRGVEVEFPLEKFMIFLNFLMLINVSFGYHMYQLIRKMFKYPRVSGVIWFLGYAQYQGSVIHLKEQYKSLSLVLCENPLDDGYSPPSVVLKRDQQSLSSIFRLLSLICLKN